VTDAVTTVSARGHSGSGIPMVRSAVVLIAVLFVAGCGRKDPYDRQPLTGTVTFQGQPLDKGTIQFLPQDPARAFSAGALIQDGRFQVSREQGLPPGTYRVAITSPAPSKGPAVEPAGAPGLKMPPLGTERIPAAFNTATTLTAEVTADGNNAFEFVIP
jgi:hypothetical protein